MVSFAKEPTAEDLVYAAVKISTEAALAGNMNHACFMSGMAQGIAYVHGLSYVAACERQAQSKMPAAVRSIVDKDVEHHVKVLEAKAREIAQ